jgi:hypothetical protein
MCRLRGSGVGSPCIALGGGGGGGCTVLGETEFV